MIYDSFCGKNTHIPQNSALQQPFTIRKKFKKKSFRT